MFIKRSIPFAIKKIGLRNTIITGPVFLFICYATFYFGATQNVFWLYLIGVIVHGLIFGYFYLGGKIYIDKMAPEDLRAQAQGFIFFEINPKIFKENPLQFKNKVLFLKIINAGFHKQPYET